MLTALPLLLAFFQEVDFARSVKSFIDVFATVEREGADPVDVKKAFFEGALPGALRRLDPHSVFFDPDQFEQLKQMQKSTSKGFGSVVSVLPGRVIVLQTQPGSPSGRSGISAGDEILAVNNIRLDYLDMDQLVQVLSQSKQSPAQLVVRRPGNARLLEFTLTPQEMQAPSVERVFHVRPGVGYVRVGSFDEDTGKLIHDAIEKLGGTKLKGLVLDLRNNPGGVLPEAIKTASLFLKVGQKVLSAKGRKVADQDMNVPVGNEPYTFPVSILINSKSASSSEIVAGALQDHDRGTVIGEISYGKGLVQNVFPLSQQTGIALTTAYYYTPSGRSIQKTLAGSALEQTTAAAGGNYKTDAGRPVKGGGGIQPDIEVQPERMTRLRVALDASGSFPNYATEFLKQRPAPIVGDKFRVASVTLDRFRIWLADRNIQPGLGEWSKDSDWIAHRLTQEIVNQAIGVEKGDEIEAERDTAILAALQAMKLQP